MKELCFNYFTARSSMNERVDKLLKQSCFTTFTRLPLSSYATVGSHREVQKVRDFSFNFAVIIMARRSSSLVNRLQFLARSVILWADPTCNQRLVVASADCVRIG